MGGGRGEWLGGTTASAEHEPITGVWGRAPSGVQGQRRSPPEAESILVIGCPTEPANSAPFQKCLALQGINRLTVDLSALRHIGEPHNNKSGGAGANMSLRLCVIGARPGAHVRVSSGDRQCMSSAVALCSRPSCVLPRLRHGRITATPHVVVWRVATVSAAHADSYYPLTVAGFAHSKEHKCVGS